MSEFQRISFPAATRFDRIVAKEKIMKQSGSSVAVKKLFQDQVGQIRCFHELSEEKMNLKSSVAVPKILIIQVIQKGEKLDGRILEAMDKAFGVPLIFELIYNQQCAYAACYRRRRENDATQWVFSDYYYSNWMPLDATASPIPVALSLASLYEQLIRRLLPISSDEPLPALMARISELQKVNREIEKLESRIQKEKQFNRRVELNRKLNALKQELNEQESKEK